MGSNPGAIYCMDIWTFFALICCENCIVCLKRLKIKEKEAWVGPFKKTWRQYTPLIEELYILCTKQRINHSDISDKTDQNIQIKFENIWDKHGLFHLPSVIFS